MENQLKNIGKLLAVIEAEMPLSVTQVNKAIANPLAFYPWAIKEIGSNPKDPKAVSEAIARIDAQIGFPAMLTNPQQSIVIAAYYGEKAKAAK